MLTAHAGSELEAAPLRGERRPVRMHEASECDARMPHHMADTRLVEAHFLHRNLPVARSVAVAAGEREALRLRLGLELLLSWRRRRRRRLRLRWWWWWWWWWYNQQFRNEI